MSQHDLGQSIPEHFSFENKDRLREVERIIGSIVLFSSDGKLLMGQKDPAKGGVYRDAWHILGGGVNEGESTQQAAVREANEEAQNLNLTEADIVRTLEITHGEAEKTDQETGERIWCKMTFNRYEVHLSKTAAEMDYLQPGDDLVKLQWFTPEEQKTVLRAGGDQHLYIKVETAE